MKMSIRAFVAISFIGLLFLGGSSGSSVYSLADDAGQPNEQVANGSSEVSLTSLAIASAQRQSDELRRYRVQIFVAVADSVDWSSQHEATFRAQLQTRLEALVGGLWQCQINRAPLELYCNSTVELNHLAGEAYRLHTTTGSKSIVVLIVGSPDSLQIAAREYDDFTQSLGGPQIRRVVQSNAVIHAAAEQIWKAFRPLARIESFDDNNAVLRMHGGRLVWPANSTGSKAGSLFQPVVRRANLTSDLNDSSSMLNDPALAVETPAAELPQPAGGEPTAQAKTIDWNWLSIVRNEGSLLHCDVHSGLASPPALVRDGRNQYLAIANNATGSTTAIEILDATTGRPLSEVTVAVTSSQSGDPLWYGRTDANGIVPLRVHPAQLAFLEVRQGPLLISRLPIVTGHASKLQLRVEPSASRAAAIDEVQRIRSDLIEAVARREVLLVRARRAVLANDYRQGERLLSQIRALPDGPRFAAAFASANKSLAGDAVKTLEQDSTDVQSDELRKLIAVYINNELVDQLAAVLARQHGPAVANESAKSGPSQPPVAIGTAPADPFATAPAGNSAPTPTTPKFDPFEVKSVGEPMPAVPNSKEAGKESR